jgi:hypothetical protein
MSITGLGSTTGACLQKTAPDGDSPAVEAAESRATKLAEKLNGGFTPEATDATAKAFNAAMGKGTNIDAIG